MLLKLRVTFTVLAAICLAAAIPAGIFWDWIGILSFGALALCFFVAMLFCKSAQESAEKKANESSFLSKTEKGEQASETTDRKAEK